MIEDDLKAIQPKLDISASDWTAEEKKHIESAYFAITKVSVGWGRTVDTGCSECVQSAVNVIKNYQVIIKRTENGEETQQNGSEATTLLNWRDTLKSIDAEAKEQGFEFPKDVKTKDKRIEALEEFIASKSEKQQKEEVEQEYSKEQLAEIVKAKTGEDINACDYTYEQLLQTVTELSEEDGNSEEE